MGVPVLPLYKVSLYTILHVKSVDDAEPSILFDKSNKLLLLFTIELFVEHYIIVFLYFLVNIYLNLLCNNLVKIY